MLLHQLSQIQEYTKSNQSCDDKVQKTNFVKLRTSDLNAWIGNYFIPDMIQRNIIEVRKN